MAGPCLVLYAVFSPSTIYILFILSIVTGIGIRVSGFA